MLEKKGPGSQRDQTSLLQHACARRRMGCSLSTRGRQARLPRRGCRGFAGNIECICIWCSRVQGMFSVGQRLQQRRRGAQIRRRLKARARTLDIHGV